MAETRKSSKMVVVACRLPHGLAVPLPGHDAPVMLKGLNAPGSHSGHGFTNMKTETWEAIKTVYGDKLWLKNKSVFAFADADSATDAAVERQDFQAGFNGIDPKDPSASVRGMSGIKIEMAV
jgi:hypothetical protein